MANGKALSEVVAKLNEVSDLLSALKAGDLRHILASGGPRAAGCDYDCACHQSCCSCRGKVQSDRMGMMSFPEFLKLRETRLAELKNEIRRLEES